MGFISYLKYMKLKDFIEKLEKIRKENGDDIKVIMADNISIISPIFTKDYPDGKNVVITDKND